MQEQCKAQGWLHVLIKHRGIFVYKQRVTSRLFIMSIYEESRTHEWDSLDLGIPAAKEGQKYQKEFKQKVTNYLG